MGEVPPTGISRASPWLVDVWTWRMISLIRATISRMSVLSRVLGALLLCASLSAQTRLGISRADWGITAKSEQVAIYTLAGAGGLEARISNFGGVVVTLNVPNRNGSKTDVMLGYDDLASYEKGGVYGARSDAVASVASRW